jgi:hypothetical protein
VPPPAGVTCSSAAMPSSAECPLGLGTEAEPAATASLSSRGLIASPSGKSRQLLHARYAPLPRLCAACAGRSPSPGAEVDLEGQAVQRRSRKGAFASFATL